MRPDPRPRPRAGGFTIIELLIAATISMILTYAVIQMFDYVASEARYGRASIELAGQLRSASRRISTDLACATATMRPMSDRVGLGYFEYVEGPGRDGRTSAVDVDASGLPQIVGKDASVGGDFDDLIMFTAFNPDEPFKGRWTTYPLGTQASKTTVVIESKYAEIAIWTTVDAKGRLKLHRRALLIRPDLVSDDFFRTRDGSSIEEYRKRFLQENDVSVRYDSSANAGVGGLVGNTLVDLSRRENRFAHVRTTFPFAMDFTGLQLIDNGWTLTEPMTPAVPASMVTTDNYVKGNDVLLSELLAFDVKAYDPTAYVRFDRNHFHLTPSDAGYYEDFGHTAATGTPTGMIQVQTGAFVDLGFRVASPEVIADPSVAAPVSTFSQYPHVRSQLAPAAGGGYRTFDTWSLFYEMNGYDANGNGTLTVAEGNEDNTANLASNVPDAGVNGVDDDGDNLIDEEDEWDTRPPYLAPLRGVQITLRVMEPNSRQVRQMTIVQNFSGE